MKLRYGTNNVRDIIWSAPNAHPMLYLNINVAGKYDMNPDIILQ